MSSSLMTLVETANAVRDTASRLEKRDLLAAYLRTLEPDEVRLACRYLAGEVPQGKLGVGWNALSRASDARPSPQRSLFETAPDDPLKLTEVDTSFSQLREVSGKGAGRRRQEILASLFARASPVERGYLRRLIGGELRQGALRALVLEGLGDAFEVEPEALRRAVMVAGDFGEVARALAAQGSPALAEFRIQPLQPVEPMLASTADDLVAVVAEMGRAAVEWKLDGVRVQIHRAGNEIRVFSRQLRDITASVPNAVSLARGLPAERFILDGEVIGRDARGRLLPFQKLMSVISRETPEPDVTLEVLVFDALLIGDDVLLDQPYEARMKALDRLVPAERRMPRQVVEDPETAESAYRQALDAGHEGVMVKDLASPYRAGRRGAHWRKAKPAETVDLVILAAEWGSGRRRGWLSNLHLGARVPGTGEFVMLGKTFKGLTDEMLAHLTEDLPTVETHRDEHTVFVRPMRVVEIAFDGLQRSRRYDSGLALRFARVKRFRPDKGPGQATTIEEIRAIYARP